MKTEKEIQEKIEEILKKWHSELRTNLSEWIAATYTIETLHWVLDNLETLPVDNMLKS